MFYTRSRNTADIIDHDPRHISDVQHSAGPAVNGDKVRRSNAHSAVTLLSPARRASAQDSDAAVSVDSEVAVGGRFVFAS